MRKSLFIPNAMICILWKAVCSETGLYSLGRGVRHEAVGRAVRVEQNKISPGMLLPVPYQDMRLE